MSGSTPPPLLRAPEEVFNKSCDGAQRTIRIASRAGDGQADLIKMVGVPHHLDLNDTWGTRRLW